MRVKNKMGVKKVRAMKKEVRNMWNELETTFNLDGIIQQENEIKEQKKNLLSLYEETQA